MARYPTLSIGACKNMHLFQNDYNLRDRYPPTPFGLDLEVLAFYIRQYQAVR